MFKGIDHLYRLNVPGDLLESRFDDWQDWTVQDIKDATEIYLGTAGVENDIDLIAKEAVRIRRARAQTERWEAFAINMHYTCSLCIRQTPVTFEDRPGLRAHLGESHADRDMSDQEVENFFNGCRKYRGRSG
ncbi:hypothetical protein FVEG_14578 [Fusarium verticillioides 7600]|uniref:Uncharacterized protein n=1 Tax=Gibberella moniliformis (strain M3125 / FGSC 7600) TaxID=334819 RepID=W7LJY7_GIBM7|nr:hypothetical protein FVEG_14578 [Fusarium verticillioides 7600]EWG35865.1 hypothetical protein FVEG_14578 [Fusarium verticillioides 7600]